MTGLWFKSAMSRAYFEENTPGRSFEQCRMIGPLEAFVLQQGDIIIDRAEKVDSLAFAAIDSYIVWSVYADFGGFRRRIAYSVPCPVSFGDATFAVGTDFRGGKCYVDGSDFVASVIRARLARFDNCGEFESMKPFMLHVSSTPVFTTNGPASSK